MSTEQTSPIGVLDICDFAQDSQYDMGGFASRPIYSPFNFTWTSGFDLIFIYYNIAFRLQKIIWP